MHASEPAIYEVRSISVKLPASRNTRSPDGAIRATEFYPVDLRQNGELLSRLNLIPPVQSHL
jgi:hypothetical protein